MTPLVIVLALALPLFLTLGYAHGALRPALHRALPFAPLPALLLALVMPSGTVELPWLLEGAAWGLDGLRRGFLAFTALLWALAGFYARHAFEGRQGSHHFALFWLFSLGGNLGLILAQDIASFYTFFSIMTLTSFGLVAHRRSPLARRAGRWYLSLAIAGEMTLLAGLIIAAAPGGLTRLADVPQAVAASEYRHWVIALLFFGFGVKSGVALLHLWLPLSYLAAPVPGSAALGGAMINAGLLGWLFTLPLGHTALPGWGALICALGLLSVFGAALIGVCQDKAKAVLAYSSISQMGLMVLPLGLALALPAAAPSAIAAIAFYAMHHGLAKAALFLSVGAAPHAGHWPRPVFWLLAALPALSLCGLPLTSGAAAKETFKEVLAADAPLALAPWFGLLLSAGAVATTLLVARFLWCLRGNLGGEPRGRALPLAWSLAALSSLLLFWLLPRPPALPWPAAEALPAGLSHPLEAGWPLALGLALAAAALALRLKAPPIPPGDLAVPLEKAWGLLHPRLPPLAAGLARGRDRVRDGARRAVRRARAWSVQALEAEGWFRDRATFAFLLVVGGLLVLLAV